jgi:dissimilatory sulfite reductase (desulfoviridin) alpha/beta subunit
MGAIKVLEEKARIDREKCILCGACIATCKKDALRAEITGYTIFVGGSMGRNPRHGMKIVELADKEQLFSILEKTVDYYRKYGLDGERLGELLDRLGIEKYREEVLS